MTHREKENSCSTLRAAIKYCTLDIFLRTVISPSNQLH